MEDDFFERIVLEAGDGETEPRAFRTYGLEVVDADPALLGVGFHDGCIREVSVPVGELQGVARGGTAYAHGVAALVFVEVEFAHCNKVEIFLHWCTWITSR